MTIRWWGMLTLAAFLGLAACGKKGPLEPPPGAAEEMPAPDQTERPDDYTKPQGTLF